jgi:hypothetical protein
MVRNGEQRGELGGSPMVQEACAVVFQAPGLVPKVGGVGELGSLNMTWQWRSVARSAGRGTGGRAGGN